MLVDVGACGNDALLDDIAACVPCHGNATTCELVREACREGQLQVEAVKSLGMGEDLGRRPVEGNVTVVEHDDAVGLERLLHVVRDVYDRGARTCQFAGHTHDGGASSHVEHGAGLVQHQKAGTHGQGAGDGHPLLLPAAHPRGVRRRMVGQAHAMELALHALVYLGRLHTQVLGAKGDVVGNDGGDDLVLGVLKHEAYAAPCLAVGFGIHAALWLKDVVPCKGDLALIGGHEAGKDVGERGLARAVGAQHAHALVLLQRQADAVEGPGEALIVGQADVAQLGRRRGGSVLAHASCLRRARRSCRLPA